MPAWDTLPAGAAIDAHYQALQGLTAGTLTPGGRRSHGCRERIMDHEMYLSLYVMDRDAASKAADLLEGSLFPEG